LERFWAGSWIRIKPARGNKLTTTDLPWLAAHKTQLRAAFAAGHLAHALLIHESRGSGGDILASWLACLLLCTHPSEAPCGSCLGCRRAASAQHPDLITLGFLEESRQIRIEQVRELASALAFTSHQGGYKVAILSPADALNRNAANALLKTLEEPTPRTILILVATQPSRLPATLLSRCQRVHIRAPSRAEAIAWLQAVRGPNDWNSVLDTLGDAPLLAAEVDAKVVIELATETWRVLEETRSGRADPVVTAERWGRHELALRLVCIENWLTDRIRRYFAASGFSVEMSAGSHLHRGPGMPSIRKLFGLVDAVEELKASLDAPLNRVLALENLLRRLTPS
jgi:DNA polymerase-3 subunit delta'